MNVTTISYYKLKINYPYNDPCVAQLASPHCRKNNKICHYCLCGIFNKKNTIFKSHYICCHNIKNMNKIFMYFNK